MSIQIHNFFRAQNRKRRWYRRGIQVSKAIAEDLANATPSQLDRIYAALAKLRPQLVDIPLKRFGSRHDGGYLIPDDLEGIDALFSPGVSDAIQFDLQIAHLGIDCLLADASVDAPEGLLPNMRFEKKFIGQAQSENTITLDQWVEMYAPGKRELLLQMDIEGAEFDVLASCRNDLLERFRIIVVKIHDLHKLLNAGWFARFEETVTKLTRSHVPCHVHANNFAPYFRFQGRKLPKVMELTFIRKDRVKILDCPPHIPHPLDQPNSITHPDVPTPQYWKNEAS